MSNIITRFAPSPTGLMHFGSARAAILPFLFSQHYNGKFFLRIDDTDVQRNKEEFVQTILQDLKWLGIQYEYIIFQNERKKIYDHYFFELLKQGHIYPCYESEEEIEMVRKSKRMNKQAPIFSFQDKQKQKGNNHHWRFKLSEEMNEINDLIFGRMQFKKEWSDPVIKRSDETYCYIFCSIIDDIEENVTHIIRGAEHIANAVIQQQIANLIKKCQIIWAHFPMLLSFEGSKLSKRNESLSIKSLREASLESWTLVSLLMEIGSSNKKVISYDMHDYSEVFYLEKFSKVPKKFFEKELWERNKLIFRNLPDQLVIERNIDLSAWKLLKNNCIKWSEFQQMYDVLIKFKNSNLPIPEDKSIYIKTLGTESGPAIKDLLQYLKS